MTVTCQLMCINPQGFEFLCWEVVDPNTLGTMHCINSGYMQSLYDFGDSNMKVLA